MEPSLSGRSRESLLAGFVEWASRHVKGDEKGEAQIFLDHLFRAFGQKGSLDVGGTAEMRIRKADEDGGGTSFADYVWKPVVLIEMKKRGTDLSKHYRQAFDYWVRLVPDRPQYVVLCNFDEFWVYDFNNQIDSPKDKVKLGELPEKWGPLAFLFPTKEKPTFGNDREKVTREAADRLALCFKKLIARKVERGLAQRFILQSLVALFSEDIGLLPRYMLGTLLADCHKPADSYDLIGGLFEAMNTPDSPTGGRYKSVRYFNGGIFANPARLELYEDELNQLKASSASDWSKVSPDIFGALFQDSMDAEERHAYGAHFTSPIDILKIIGPTITQPWEAAIQAAKNAGQLNALLERLTTLRVLDPACGSGNFLYLAYREMKRLESLIRQRLTSDFPGEQPQLIHVNARQFFGMDINPFAVELAKVTLMIARKLAIDELHIADEKDLPLDNLDGNFRIGDALLTTLVTDGEGDDSDIYAGAIRTPWPEADVIIGNPPFLGAKRLKPERGAAYVNAIRKMYKQVPGMADYCVYWFRRAHDHLPACTMADPLVGRGGLVGTQNVRNNQSRIGGLDHIVKTGRITEAVDNQPWSGDAHVHVSIVNWVKSVDPAVVPKQCRLWSPVESEPGAKKRRASGSGSADKVYELTFRKCGRISSSLANTTDVSAARSMSCNTTPQRVFQGVTPGYKGFVLSPDERKAIIKSEAASEDLIRPYLIGREIVSGSGKPRRFLIDADGKDVISLSRYRTINQHLIRNVLPKIKDKLKAEIEKKSDMVKARAEHLERWWTFWARRTELRSWLNKHDRIVAASRTQRIPYVFEFISCSILPGDKLQLFAFEDDYSFGIIQGNAHSAWYAAKGARLKNEADYNYSSDSVFDTFPWPQSPTKKQIDAVAVAAVSVRKIRTAALTQIDGGLRTLYRTLELPGRNPLKDAHAALDAAVLAAYGFDAKKDLLSQLLDLNRFVAGREKAGEPVTPPGVPGGYGDPTALITDDCIRPSQR